VVHTGKIPTNTHSVFAIRNGISAIQHIEKLLGEKLFTNGGYVKEFVPTETAKEIAKKFREFYGRFVA
jgi:hypothetical protein